MLPKLYKLIDEVCEVKLNKYAGGKDISDLGALECGESFELRLRVSRRLGAAGVVLRIAKDGEKDIDMPFSRTAADEAHDLYSLVIDTNELCGGAECGLFYYELLFLRGFETLFTSTFNNKDFTLEEKSGGRFRLVISKKGYKTPDSFGKGVMYQIFTDRFYRGESEEAKSIKIRDDARFEDDWEGGIPEYPPYPGAPMKNNTFFGGNLWGVAEKLDYLADLGVSVIYLCPIFEAYSNHKYDTADYTRIDGMFGGEEAFDNLVQRAREKGIGIILDGVFNHTGDNSVYFNRYKKYGDGGAYNDPLSPYADWYRFRSYPDDYESWWGIEILPKLNHKNESCRHYFTGEGGIIEKYIRRGIAGWRLDVADELSDEFLCELRERAKEASDGEAVIIGEVWENAAEKVAYGQRRRYFLGDQLDSVMNYPLKNAIVAFCQWGDAEILYDTLTEIYASYPRCVSDKLMNLLGTHDTERILTVLGREDDNAGESPEVLSRMKLSERERERGIRLLKIAAALQFTAYGIPSVYYGDEVGLEGYGDPFCRMPFPWHETSGGYRREILEYYKMLGRMRRDEDALDGGDFHILSHTESAIAYCREKGESCLLVIANRGESFYLELDGEHNYRDIESGEVFRSGIEVLRDTAVILKREKI